MIKFAVGALLTLCVWTSAMASDFVYEIQRAGYAFERSDKMGVIAFPEFVHAFREFNWRDQAGKANGASEATISVNDRTNQTTLFVSVIGNSSEYAYILGIVHTKQQRPILGLISRPPIKWVDMYLTDDPAVVEAIFRTYFSSSLSATISQLQRLDHFDSQPAANES